MSFTRPDAYMHYAQLGCSVRQVGLLVKLASHPLFDALFLQHSDKKVSDMYSVREKTANISSDTTGKRRDMIFIFE